MPTIKRYVDLDARNELEQQVAKDLEAALKKRGATVKHHGTPSSHAPSTAPADITVDWGTGTKATRLLVEVAQRTNESEFTSITEHLDRAVAAAGRKFIHCLYAGRSTSVRLAKFIRNENLRRKSNNISGRIIFIRLNDLQDLLLHWKASPAANHPIDGLVSAVARWDEFTSDVLAFRILQSEVFPDWTEKAAELDVEVQKSISLRQERLRKDIIRLENKLRESGITGTAAHKTLIFLFFAALYEDKRGLESRITLENFGKYRESLSLKAKANFSDRTVHHLLSQEIQYDPEIEASGLMGQYEPINLSDDFIYRQVIPIFESYPLSEGGMDFIGAVFEALARRAEKDNRIGQFFTPETAVQAASRLVQLSPTDVVLDPACGTGRFLIHAMSTMLAQSAEVPGKTQVEVENNIKQHLLLGTDIDPWVATIAKMNMYLHGDGKSNVISANGLALSTGTPFAARQPAYLDGTVDVVLTNPPLGDVNFRDIALKLATTGMLGTIREAPGTPEYHATASKLANDWTSKKLSVVPHTCVEVAKRESLEKSIARWELKIREHIVTGDDKAERKAIRYKNDVLTKVADLNTRIGAGNVTYQPSGNTAKGGALFLSAIVDYLKPIRDPHAPEEWKGGLIGIVIDEAVLNTAAYRTARDFLTAKFFVKAVISLPREAFKFLARTSAKTSILLLAKKPDPAVRQTEPIFFAKAEVIGYTSSGITDQNDLPEINAAFEIWREAIQSSYVKGMVSTAALSKAKSKVKAARVHFYQLDPNRPGERLDYSYRRMLELVDQIDDPVRLGDLLEVVVRHPEEKDVHEYAWVSREDGRVRSKGEQDLNYSEKELRLIQEGDILLSGIDVVKGSIGLVGAECQDLVVSKEFFTLRPRGEVGAELLPEYLVCLLRSPFMREIIEGTVTGVSNRTRIEDINRFLDMQLPRPAPMHDQRRVATQLTAAYRAQDEAIAALATIEESMTLRG